MKKLVILPHGLWVGFAAWIFFWRAYIQIPEKMLSPDYRAEDLWLEVSRESWSWWQKREIIRHAATRKCTADSDMIQAILSGDRTEFRTALIQGCLTHPPTVARFILPFALADQSLSFNRLIALEYIEKHQLVKEYEQHIHLRAQDSSSMVRAQAQRMMQQSPE